MMRSRSCMRQRASILAVLLAMVAGGLLAVAPEANADPLTPPPTSGTATGSYRTGLARAGLVQLTSLGAAHVWLGVQDSGGGKDAFDVHAEPCGADLPPR